MTSNNHYSNLTDLQISAALCEEIYRRNDKDYSLNVSDELGLTSVDYGDIPGLTRNISETGDVYYYSTKGFVGRVVSDGSKLYVVFRGTDSAEGFLTGAYSAITKGVLGNLEIRNDPSDNKSDLGDWGTNSLLGGSGTFESTQLEDALLLTRIAKQDALSNNLSIQVTGQSLGGGLAGLVGVIEDLESIMIAPAPFYKQLKIEAVLKALAPFGVTKDIVPTWSNYQYYHENGNLITKPVLDCVMEGGTYLYGVVKTNLPHLTEQELNSILTSVTHTMTTVDEHLKVHTITGETLSDGLPAALGAIIGSHQITSTRNDYYLGVDPSWWVMNSVTDALHGASLHNLVLRTQSEIKYGENTKPQSFSELLINSEFLRYAFLRDQNISGPKSNDRSDPTDPAYGGSGVNSSNDGSTAAILFRALWKSVGVEGGFYDKFYTAFSKHLSSDAVKHDELRKGLTFLGLQVIRDGLRDANGNAVLSEIAANPYELAGLTNGAGVDLSYIHDSIVNGQVSDSVFGYLDANDGLKETLRSYLSATQLDQHGLKINLDLTAWRTLIHGNNSGSLIYITDESRKNVSHAIVGSSGNDFIVGSNANDIIIANAGTNHIAAGSGNDYVIGGTGRNVIFGEDGNDTIIAGLGYDQYIHGGNGDDYIVAVGAGKYYGGAGDDTFVTRHQYTTSGSRDVDGGTGYDIVYLQNLDLMHVKGFSMDGSNRTGFMQGPSHPSQWELLQFGSTYLTDFEEFRVGWTFNASTESWAKGTFGKTYLKDELYNLLLTGDNREASGFSDTTYAVVSADNFKTSGVIVIYQGTVAGAPPLGVYIPDNIISVVEIGGKSYALKASFNGHVGTFYIETSEPINFNQDVVFNAMFALRGFQIDPETGELQGVPWDGFAYRFTGVVSTSLAANPMPLPPIGDIFVSGGIIADMTTTFTGIVFNTENWTSSSTIEWRITSSHDGNFYILPNGELHSLKPINLSAGASLQIDVQAFDGTKTVSQKFGMTSSGAFNLIEGTDDNDTIFDTAFNDNILGGDGDDVIWSRGGRDFVDAGAGNDKLMIETHGTFLGGDGNDIFDLSSMSSYNNTYMSGSIYGGTGNDIVHLNSVDDFDFRIDNNGAHLTAKGFYLSAIEEYRLGWSFNESTMTWSAQSGSSTALHNDLMLKGLRGEIKGVNGEWQTVHTSIVDEEIPHIGPQNMIVFSGTLAVNYPNVTLTGVDFWLGGIKYNAEVNIMGSRFDVSVLSSEIGNIVGDKYYHGVIKFISDQYPSLIYKDITFGGLMRDVYDPANMPMISGDNELYTSENDELLSYSFSIANLTGSAPITWSLSGAGSEHFTITEDGRISSIGALNFGSLDKTYNITIHATNGFTTISKMVSIKPLVFENVIEGTSGNDLIHGTWRSDTIHAGNGDDIIYSSGGFDFIYGEDGDDTIIASSVGHFDGGNGNDTFDISNVIATGAEIGVINGGAGHDVIYLDDLARTSFSNISGTISLLVNGFKVSSVEEFRIGWEKDANGTWSEAENSQKLTYWDLFEKAAEGEIEGLNADWQNISISSVNESLEHTGERVIVFQGKLKSALPTGTVISDARITFNGVNYAAEVSVVNGVYTITLPKSFIADVSENTIFEGGIYSRHTNGALVKQMGFAGIIRDIYDLPNAPTQIIGDTVLDASEIDILEPYQFSVDNFNQDKPITWSISGSGSEFFTISNNGVLSSVGTLDFAVPYDLVIQATDGFKTVTKYVYIEAYNPVNVIWGTSGDDIIYGTAQDDIIYGLGGDDIITAGGGFDTVYGGTGNDTLIATDFYVDFYGEDGDDILIGSHRGDYLYGGDGNDILYGGGYKDRMWGGEGADIFVYKDVTDSDYWDLDLSDRIFDLEDDDAFDFTEMGDVSFDWANGPAGSLYVEVNWQPNKQYGYLSIDVDRDGEFDMAIDFDAGAAGLTQINFVNGPTYYLNSPSSFGMASTSSARLSEEDLFASPVADNANNVEQQYHWAA